MSRLLGVFLFSWVVVSSAQAAEPGQRARAEMRLADEKNTPVRWGEIGRWLTTTADDAFMVFPAQRWRLALDRVTLQSASGKKSTRVPTTTTYADPGHCFRIGEATYYPAAKLVVIFEWGGGHEGCMAHRVLRVAPGGDQ